MKLSAIFLFPFLFLLFSTTFAQDKTLTPGIEIDNSFPDGESHIYLLELEAGQFVHVSVEQIGIDVVVAVFDPHEEKINEVDGPGIGSPEEVTLEAKISGIYKFHIYPFISGEEGNYKVRVKELLTVSEYKERLEIQHIRRMAVAQWVKDNAVPLKGVEAEQGFEDMQPLKQIIGDARIVALGEATHGTREFFQLKHRMLEFLVTEMGFNIFAIEAIMPEGFDVNEYVLTGKGDPEKALAGLYFWTWNTEEVLEMIHWMRRYNADPNHKEKIRFYGNDMQNGTRALKVLENYLNRVDSKAAEVLGGNASMALIRCPYKTHDFSDVSKDEKLKALEIVGSTITAMDKNKEKYISQSSQDSWDIARLHGNILSQYVENKTIGFSTAGSNNRDSCMAANVNWIMEHEGPGSKMVIWAHNGHVADQQYTMGHYLRDVYGSEMRIFGFIFNQGSFQANDFTSGIVRGLIPFHVKPLESESLDATLGSAGYPYAAIDLRMLPDDGNVAEWFSKPHKTRHIGAFFYPELAPNYGKFEKANEQYDVLLFVDETTSARPNPGGTRIRFNSWSSPENLDFEESEPGLIPEGWSANKYSLANFDFTVETSTDNPKQGRQCLKINRNPGKHYGEKFGSLRQRIDAAPYHNKRIKLKAAVRTDVKDPENNAYLWLTVSKEGFGPESNLFEDRMADRPISTSDWQFFEITGDVPEDAKFITFGMALDGEGTAWFDDFSLEVVE